MRHRKGNKSGERGGVLLEATIAFPFLLVLIAGIVEFGFAFRERAMLTDCLRVAARLVGQQPPIVWQPGLGEDNLIPLRNTIEASINNWLGSVGVDSNNFEITIESAAMVFGTEIMPYVRIKIDRKLANKRAVLWPSVSVSSCVKTFTSARITGNMSDMPLESSLAPVCN